jgi:hypothetical protein
MLGLAAVVGVLQLLQLVVLMDAPSEVAPASSTSTNYAQHQYGLKGDGCQQGLHCRPATGPENCSAQGPAMLEEPDA